MNRTSQRILEYQRNAAFAGFMAVVVLACGLYLIEALRYVLMPLIWASFFALPLERTACHLNSGMIRGLSWLLRRCRKRADDESDSVSFRHVPGSNRIIVQRTPGNMALLNKVNNPCVSSPCVKMLQPAEPPLLPERQPSNDSGSGFRITTRGTPLGCLGCGCTVIFKCCQRRMRIANLDDEVVDNPGGAVNRLVENWSYYVKQVESSSADELHVELYLDPGMNEYPAVVEESDVYPSGRQVVTGILEMNKTSPISWAFTVVILVFLLLGGVAIFIYLIYIGVQTFESNLDNYKKGIDELVKSLKEIPWLSQDVLDQIGQRITSFLEKSVSTYAAEILADTSSFLFQALMFVIYLLFWLTEPIPVSSSVVEVFKAYLFLKTLVCILFASLMGALLWYLDCGLWPLFLIISFVLNYIPEIGALVVGFLSLPAVLFDGSVEPFDRRLQNTLALIILGVTFKIITANVIEVQLYTTRGGQFMRMHSVVLMVMIMLFWQVLGLTGMFLSVPLVAAIKFYLVSTDMPSMLLNPLISLIEGDDTAPHRNFVDKLRAHDPGLASTAPTSQQGASQQGSSETTRTAPTSGSFSGVASTSAASAVADISRVDAAPRMNQRLLEMEEQSNCDVQGAQRRPGRQGPDGVNYCDSRGF